MFDTGILPYIGEAQSGDDRKDAESVGNAILELVKTLELSTNLKNYKIGEDQAPKITKLATRQESGPLYDKVIALVHNLYG
ncbi:hypothetical protein B0A49_06681 [Cryomyces minteri]|uniref:Uncharacterized protein n=1 Tax=Cryomyces minteri TaxID=331657 RepID=A0A4U0WW29_9PEZI|nr:hypothetical protein B0A49_06681 [Cryomyces minteri]